LFYHQQFSLEEVANYLNISVGAVKGRLHKSRHQLREQLSPLQPQVQPNSRQEIPSMKTNVAAPSQPEVEFCCSFCHKPQTQVNLLIAGPLLGNTPIFICNECINICHKIVNVETPPLTQEKAETLVDSGKFRA
jgi:RNA polymerase sigma-70 factor, ECF subfamily